MATSNRMRPRVKIVKGAPSAVKVNRASSRVRVLAGQVREYKRDERGRFAAIQKDRVIRVHGAGMAGARERNATRIVRLTRDDKREMDEMRRKMPTQLDHANGQVHELTVEAGRPMRMFQYAQEAKIANAPIEFAIVIDRYGAQIGYSTGDHGSVSITGEPAAILFEGLLLHNHPGGSSGFSDGDILHMVNANTHEERVTGIHPTDKRRWTCRMAPNAAFRSIAPSDVQRVTEWANYTMMVAFRKMIYGRGSTYTAQERDRLFSNFNHYKCRLIDKYLQKHYDGASLNYSRVFYDEGDDDDAED